jgi:hypothetical protein
MSAAFSLEQVRVTVPCQASWVAMRGDDRVRYCGRCEQHVYNLSGMSRADAEALLRQREGRLCVRYYRRPDGTVLTKNCQAFAATRRWVAAGIGLAGAMLVGLLAVFFTSPAGATGRIAPAWAHEVEPFRTILEWIEPQPMVMGAICPPLAPAPGGGVPPGPDAPDAPDEG